MEAPPGPEPMELDAPPPAAAEAAAAVPPAGSDKVSWLCPDLVLGSDLAPGRRPICCLCGRCC